jgi:iron complex outermembrane receptor protein
MTVEPAIPLVTENERENKVWYQDLENHFITSKNNFFLNRYKIDINLSYQSNRRKLQTSENMPAFKMVDMILGTANYEVKIYFPNGRKNEFITGSQGLMQKNTNNNAPEHVIPDANVSEVSFFGLYTYRGIKHINFQAGGRYDFRKLITNAEPGKSSIDKHYGNFSGSFGGTWQLFETLLVRTNLASAYRIPNIAELTQNGLHGVYYEQGDPNLNPQRSLESDISMHYHGEKFMLDLAAYYNFIRNYIFLSFTNDTIETGQQIYRYMQTNASIRGWETGIVFLPLDWVHVTSTFSHTIAQQDNGDYLPFIPQDKIRLITTLRKSKWNFFHDNAFSIGFLYAFQQNHTGQFENETPEYFLANLQMNTTLIFKTSSIMFVISIDNLLNEKYTDHLSTLKDVGYYNVGRSITFGIRFNFDHNLK